MKFSCEVSGVKRVVVIGHTSCGAIKGAIDDVQLGKPTGVPTKIKSAMDAVPADAEPRTSKSPEYVDVVAEANVRLVMQPIRERSPILREMIDSRQVGLVGGMNDLSTGEVRFSDR